MTQLLSVRDLSVAVKTHDGCDLTVLSDIALDLGEGDTLGIVGESGSGKSMLALSIIGLLPQSAKASGRILLDGVNLLDRSESELCRVRGGDIGMIFQEPMSALNPAMRIGDQIAEGMLVRRLADRKGARRRAAELLDRVGIADAHRRIDAFPHEFSGGERQRIVIAIALAAKPRLLIADEPTSALDVTVQLQILTLLKELASENRMALLLISHDLGVIANAAGRTLVMYAGTRFEEAPTRALLDAPANPYTRDLLASVPRRPLNRGRERPRHERLFAIPGSIPRLSELPEGCRFADRCTDRIDACQPIEPIWRKLLPDHGVRCVRAGQAWKP